MITVVYSPTWIWGDEKPLQRTIFFAGSIGGIKHDWRKELLDELDEIKCHPFICLNPHRPTWDDSWKQSADDPQFSAHVHWEQNNLERCDLAIFYFYPGTLAPVTMMEFGQYHHKALVCCPDGFYRKGNIDINCQRNCVLTCPDLKQMALAIKKFCNTKCVRE